MKLSYFTSLLLSFVMLLFLSTFIVSRNIPNPPWFAASSAWTMFLVFVTFMILKTGKIYKYRALFFSIYAFSFVFTFIMHLIETRGSMALTRDIIAANETPLCPVAIPMLIVPALVKHVLIFPAKLIGGPYGGFIPVLLLWFVGAVTLGKGWCSWGCFYGGIDEGFANRPGKPVKSPESFYSKWRFFPFVILVLVVIWAFIAMKPVYCEWLCPLKLVTEYPEINSLTTYIQAIIFITLGTGLLFILPIIFKKRTQCALFCPLGALQSVVGHVNPYTVKVDTDKCKLCGLCIEACPVFAINTENLKKGRVGINCTRCGKCMDVCPQNAIDFKMFGVNLTPLSAEKSIREHGIVKWLVYGVEKTLREIVRPRTLFVFTAILFGSIISGSMVTEALVRLFRLITTGSVLIK